LISSDLPHISRYSPEFLAIAIVIAIVEYKIEFAFRYIAFTYY
jgi:hypothetical protein